MVRPSVEGHNTISMTIIKQAFLSIIILVSICSISNAQQWAYNSSGTETRGSYRYASLKAGATESLRASSIYINFYDIDQKYNIYLYEVTELECSQNTIQYFTDVDREPRSFGVPSKSDGIETIAMTEIEDLSDFLTSVKSASVLTIRINNTCGTGREINFPMDNAVETVDFMTAAKTEDQVSSSSVKTTSEVKEQELSSSSNIQEQVVPNDDKKKTKVIEKHKVPTSSTKENQEKKSQPVPSSQASKPTIQELYKSIDAEWERLARKEAQLDKLDSSLVVFQSQLDKRELDLILKEQALESQSAQVQHEPAQYVPPATTYTAPVAPTINYPYRYVQFIATSAVNNYDRLSYIGQIVTEQIPGRNTIRYKVMGQWSDADISRVKNQLLQEGFEGAFESR